MGWLIRKLDERIESIRQYQNPNPCLCVCVLGVFYFYFPLNLLHVGAFLKFQFSIYSLKKTSVVMRSNPPSRCYVPFYDHSARIMKQLKKSKNEMLQTCFYITLIITNLKCNLNIYHNLMNFSKLHLSRIMILKPRFLGKEFN